MNAHAGSRLNQLDPRGGLVKEQWRRIAGLLATCHSAGLIKRKTWIELDNRTWARRFKPGGDL